MASNRCQQKIIALLKYLYSTSQSYEFLASGSVIYGFRGSPNFPVRLAHEVFHRGLQYLKPKDKITIYDPCCGCAYLLTTLAILNHQHIKAIYGSDINQDFIKVARKNLNLLTEDGLRQRAQELKTLYEKYSKDSHASALKSLQQIRQEVADHPTLIQTNVFPRDILIDTKSPIAQQVVDLIIVDVPYNQLVQWSDSAGIHKMLDQLIQHLHENSVLCIIRNKEQKFQHPQLDRLEKFKIGKRVIEILKLRALKQLL